MLATFRTILAVLLLLSSFLRSSFASHEKIRVVMDDNYPPYVFKDQSGELKGITIDQWRLWEKKTGVVVEIVATDWSVAQQQMQAGKFDVIDTIFRNEKRELLYDFTKPYADLPVPLFVHKDITGIRGAQDLKGFKVGVKSGDASIEEFKKYGVDSLVEYASYESIATEAKNGALKVFTIDRPPALYYLNKLGIYADFKETAPMYSGQFHRAVLKGKTDLLQRIETGFARISPQEYQAIDKLWMGEPLSGSPYIRYLRYTFLGTAALLALCGVWLWTLQRTVKQKTSALAESERLYRTLVENIPLGITLIGNDYRIKMVNRHQAEMFENPPEWFVGRSCFMEFENKDAICTHCPGEVAMESGTVSEVETEGVSKSGKHIKVHIRAVPIVAEDGTASGFLEVVDDITDRKRAEEEQKNMEQQLLQSQKLESLGVLAGGIAHDFNNILLAIMGNAELAKMRIRPESPAVDNLDKIETAAARAADLAKQMLAYSGKGKFVIEPINLNHLLEEMLHLLEVSISKKAILRFNLHDHLPSVKADATQMRQIVMNLVINASEAIGGKSGVIAITTGCMVCDKSYLKDVWLNENLNDGLYVYLEIADTGCGMDKETLAKLFDPFFTTKFTGRGLGMSAVLGIVRGHHGAIKVYSEPGKGTSFKILLPASDKPAELFNGHNVNHTWKGSGTVLLVDDEETVRGIGVEMLRELGFSTLTATDGRDALEQFRQHPEIRCVILDLTMPKMDGEQCFRELRILKPDIKVIMSSGYSEQEVSEKFIGKGMAGFIQKPYKLSILQDVMKKLG